MRIMPLGDPDGTMTREEFHRVRDGPKTNGDTPGCERCTKPLTGKQQRYCSDVCRAAGARQHREERQAAAETQTVAAMGSLVAQVLGVAGVSQIEVQFAGVHLTVRTKEA